MNTRQPVAPTFSPWHKQAKGLESNMKEQPGAFQEGWEKGEDENEENPYPRGSDQFFAWNMGYNSRPFPEPNGGAQLPEAEKR